MDHLNDPDLETAIGAVKLAGEFGSAAAEEKLWQRLESFYEAHKGQTTAFEDQRKSVTLISQESLEAELFAALAKSSRWLTDAGKLNRLKQLCLTPKGCEDAANWLTRFKPEIISTAYPGQGRRFSIAQYGEFTLNQLKQKLLQFPAGTNFQWLVGDGSTRDERIYEELRQFLIEQGMKLAD